MNSWHEIEIGSEFPKVINVVIEIPKGSQNKYEYDIKHNMIKLDRVLFSPFHYPGDYGIVPQTLTEDGDALDVLVLISNPSYPGVLMEARPIGVLKMVDSGKPDYKILCVAKDDERFVDFFDIPDLPKHTLKEISHFFKVYKELEGIATKIIGWGNAKEAKNVIVEASKLYHKKYGRKSK